jgi:hypothetical protein
MFWRLGLTLFFCIIFGRVGRYFFLPFPYFSDRNNLSFYRSSWSSLSLWYCFWSIIFNVRLRQASLIISISIVFDITITYIHGVVILIFITLQYHNPIIVINEGFSLNIILTVLACNHSKHLVLLGKVSVRVIAIKMVSIGIWSYHYFLAGFSTNRPSVHIRAITIIVMTLTDVHSPFLVLMFSLIFLS